MNKNRNEDDTREPSYPWAAMRVCVYAVRHSNVRRTVVKLIRFVFANIAAMLPLPLNYVQVELDMNVK